MHMIDQTQAKKQFRNLLLLILAGLLLPKIGIAAAITAAVLGSDFAPVLGLVTILLWLGLFIWIFAALWKTGGKIGVTSWAALWIFFPFFGVFIIGMLFLEPLKHLADGLPAEKRLPLTWDLIKDTWAFYGNNLGKTYKISVYYIFVSILHAAILAPAYYFGMTQYAIASVVAVVPISLGSIWVSLLLLSQIRSLEEGTSYQPMPPKEGLTKSGLFLLTALLSALVSAGPVLIATAFLLGGGALRTSGAGGNLPALTLIVGGAILLIPALAWLIYKSMVYNSFGLTLLAFEQQWGTSNLKAATRLAKSRWWGLFWKNQMAGLTFGAFGMLLSLAMSILVLILTVVFRALNLGQVINIFLTTALNGTVQIILMPLMLSFSYKLYKAFRKANPES